MVSSELQTLWGLKLLRVWHTTPIWQKPLAGNSSLVYFTYALANTSPSLVEADNAPMSSTFLIVNTAAAYSKVTASSAVGLNTNRRPQLTIMPVCTQAEGRQARKDPDRRHLSVPIHVHFLDTSQRSNKTPSRHKGDKSFPKVFNLPLISCYTRQILRQIWSIQLAFLLFIVCRIFSSPLWFYAKYFFVSHNTLEQQICATYVETFISGPN